jgi:acyl carrier protein
MLIDNVGILYNYNVKNKLKGSIKMAVIDDALLAETREELKTMLVDSLSLEDIEPSEIADDEILFGEGLGLDSLDAVEIIVMLQRNYGIELKDMEKSREVLASLDTLTRFVCENKLKTL